MIQFNSESARMHRLETTFQSCRRNFSNYSTLMFFCILFACDKQEAILTDSFKPIQIRSVGSVDDRIYFTDYEEFMDYYDYLDTLFMTNLDAFDSIVRVDSPVETINDLYSSDLEFETFLADPIIRGILNPNYEFQIGEAIVAYVNNEEILVFDEGNSTAKSSIRGLTKGEPIDIGEIPEGAYWGKPDEMARAIKIGCGCAIYIWPHTDCDFLRIWGRCNSVWGNDGDGLLIAEFDDFPLGTGIEFLNEEVSGNFNFLINVTSSLIFTNGGIVNAWVDPECLLAENASRSYNFDPATFAGCDLNHKTRSDIITNGNERMKIGTSWWRNNHGYACHKAEIRSETRADALSDWEPSRASLDVEVFANIKSPACNNLDDKDDDASCNNCKSRSTVVRWSFTDVAHCDGDLTGVYQKVRNSVTLQEDEHLVPFECCEE